MGLVAGTPGRKTGHEAEYKKRGVHVLPRRQWIDDHCEQQTL